MVTITEMAMNNGVRSFISLECLPSAGAFLLFSAVLVRFALFAAIVAFRQSLCVLRDASGVLIEQGKAGIRLRRLRSSITGSQHDKL
jgi:hypothetical protein